VPAVTLLVSSGNFTEAPIDRFPDEVDAGHGRGTQPLRPTTSVTSGTNARKRRYEELLLGLLGRFMNSF